MRFALFHTLQAGARAERRAIAAKGLTGPGYDGHAFWDTETFVLPVLTYTAPARRRDALRWRHATLGLARERAPAARARAARRSRGARSTARSARATGRPARPPSTSTPTSPTPSSATRPRPATRPSSARSALELLVETARLWRSLGHHDCRGRFRIDGVTGPDEYSAIADNNVYTNLMAQRNLRAAADAVERHPDRRRELGVDAEEMAAWRDAAEAMLDPLRRARSASTRRPRASPSTSRGTSRTPRPSSTRCCCTSPTSTSTASRWSSRPTSCWRCTCAATPSAPRQKARNFAYYEALTVRDSSLSACTQAVIAAEVGHLDLAYDYFAEAALMDLDDLEHNTRDGLHIASLAGAWIAAVAGFGGMRDHGGRLSFAPRLPPALSRLAFGCLSGAGACGSRSPTSRPATRCWRESRLDDQPPRRDLTVSRQHTATARSPGRPRSKRPPSRPDGRRTPRRAGSRAGVRPQQGGGRAFLARVPSHHGTWVARPPDRLAPLALCQPKCPSSLWLRRWGVASDGRCGEGGAERPVGAGSGRPRAHVMRVDRTAAGRVPFELRVTRPRGPCAYADASAVSFGSCGSA